MSPVDLLSCDLFKSLLRPLHYSASQRPSSGALPILCDRDRVQPAERALCSPMPQGDPLRCHLNLEVHLSIGNAQLAKVSFSGLGVQAASLLTNDLPVNCEACQRGRVARDQQDLSPGWSLGTHLPLQPDLLRGSPVGAPLRDQDFRANPVCS